MIKWYIAGYFLIGLIGHIGCRICDELYPDPDASLRWLALFFWPVLIIITFFCAIDTLFDVIASKMAKKIDEIQRKHIMTMSGGNSDNKEEHMDGKTNKRTERKD